MCINKKLEIFVQELESQKLVERISNDLTEWHENRTKNPTKFWRSGDICAALRKSDGKYHRAEVQRLIQKQRKCIVKSTTKHSSMKPTNACSLSQLYLFSFSIGSVRGFWMHRIGCVRALVQTYEIRKRPSSGQKMSFVGCDSDFRGSNYQSR